MNDLPRCPKCGELVKEIWDNQGWDGVQGPRHDEIVGYKCNTHGEIEPVFRKEDDQESE